LWYYSVCVIQGAHHEPTNFDAGAFAAAFGPRQGFRLTPGQGQPTRSHHQALNPSKVNVQGKPSGNHGKNNQGFQKANHGFAVHQPSFSQSRHPSLPNSIPYTPVVRDNQKTLHRGFQKGHNQPRSGQQFGLPAFIPLFNQRFNPFTQACLAAFLPLCVDPSVFSTNTGNRGTISQGSQTDQNHLGQSLYQHRQLPQRLHSYPFAQPNRPFNPSGFQLSSSNSLSQRLRQPRSVPSPQPSEVRRWYPGTPYGLHRHLPIPMPNRELILLDFDSTFWFIFLNLVCHSVCIFYCS